MVVRILIVKSVIDSVNAAYIFFGFTTSSVLLLNSLFNSVIYCVRIKHFRTAFIEMVLRNNSARADEFQMRVFRSLNAVAPDGEESQNNEQGSSDNSGNGICNGNNDKINNGDGINNDCQSQSNNPDENNKDYNNNNNEDNITTTTTVMTPTITTTTTMVRATTTMGGDKKQQRQKRSQQWQ